MTLLLFSIKLVELYIQPLYNGMHTAPGHLIGQIWLYISLFLTRWSLYTFLTLSWFVKRTCPWCGGQVVADANSSSLATYGVIHISLWHISAQVHILGVSCHLFIGTFHFTLHFGWPACL